MLMDIGHRMLSLQKTKIANPSYEITILNFTIQNLSHQIQLERDPQKQIMQLN